MKRISNLFLKVIVISFMAPSISFAGGLLNDYGTEKFSLVIDMMVSRMSRTSESVHRKKDSFEERNAYHNRGHFNYAIMGENSNEPDIRYFKPQGFHISANMDGELGTESLYQCSQMGMQSLLNSEIGAEENMQVASSDLRRWQVYREPRPLRYSRYKIYFIRRAIHKLSNKLKVEKNTNRISTLEKLIEKLKSSHDLFMTERSSLLEKDLKWHHRRWVRLNLDRHKVDCMLGTPIEIPRATDDQEVKNNSYINIVAFKLQEFVDRYQKLKK